MHIETGKSVGMLFVARAYPCGVLSLFYRCPGLRADLIVAEIDAAGFPHVKASLLNGRRVFAYQPAPRTPVLATA